MDKGAIGWPRGRVDGQGGDWMAVGSKWIDKGIKIQLNQAMRLACMPMKTRARKWQRGMI